MLNQLLNMSPIGLGYQAIAGSPMLGNGLQSSMPKPASGNQMGTPQFTQYNPQGSSWWSGTPGSFVQSPKFNQNQMNILQSLLGLGQNSLQSGSMPGLDFSPIAQKITKQFNEQIVPSLAERFTAMGGGQRSSAFQGALGQAGAGLGENLAASEQQFKLQQLPAIMQLLNLGLQPQFESSYIPATPGFGQGIAGGIGQGIGMLPMLLAGLL